MRPLLVGLATEDNGYSMELLAKMAGMSMDAFRSTFQHDTLCKRVIGTVKVLSSVDATNLAGRILVEHDNQRLILLGRQVTQAFERGLFTHLPTWEWVRWEGRDWLSLPHPELVRKMTEENRRRMGALILSEHLRMVAYEEVKKERGTEGLQGCP